MTKLFKSPQDMQFARAMEAYHAINAASAIVYDASMAMDAAAASILAATEREDDSDYIDFQIAKAIAEAKYAARRACEAADALEAIAPLTAKERADNDACAAEDYMYARR